MYLHVLVMCPKQRASFFLPVPFVSKHIRLKGTPLCILFLSYYCVVPYTTVLLNKKGIPFKMYVLIQFSVFVNTLVVVFVSELFCSSSCRFAVVCFMGRGGRGGSVAFVNSVFCFKQQTTLSLSSARFSLGFSVVVVVLLGYFTNVFVLTDESRFVHLLWKVGRCQVKAVFSNRGLSKSADYSSTVTKGSIGKVKMRLTGF